MKISKIKKIILIILYIVINLYIVFFFKIDINFGFGLSYDVVSNQSSRYQLFYTYDENFGDYVINQSYNSPNERQELNFSLPRNITRLRIDLGESPSQVYLYNLKIKYYGQSADIANLIDKDPGSMHDIQSIDVTNNCVKIISLGNDPYITVNLNGYQSTILDKVDRILKIIIKFISLLIFNSIFYIILKNRKDISGLFLEIYQSRRLIVNLSKNDFKSRFSGSYLGVAWAFVQPIVVVVIYWFVFQVGFKSAPMDNFPYLLWLIAGIVPWFFFNEALLNATNSFLEYSYLVKKVVFKISVLPPVKVMSAFYVHLFFIVFANVVYLLYGYMPKVYMIQVLYYSLCTFVLTLGISYITSSIVIFFKDLGQIVSIILQFGMWMTPIMYSEEMMPSSIRWILKINPMYYIVEGYRDTFIRHIWFWHRYNIGIYFWGVSIFIFLIGMNVFKKLKPHFSDVL